jgi:hypothetical protein
MNVMTGNLIPQISDRGVSIVVATLDGVEEVKPSSESEEGGIARFRITDVLSGSILRPGEPLAIPFQRTIEPNMRSRMGYNRWNTISWKPGTYIVLACRQDSQPGYWTATAGRPVDSAADPVIDDIRACYKIEQQLQDPAVSSAMLRQALASQRDLLRSYAVDCLCRRHVLGRAAGVDMMDGSIASPQAAPGAKDEMADALNKYVFDMNLGFEPANVRIVAIRARGVVKETDPERQQTWVRSLASILFGEFSADSTKDRQIRLSLIGAVKDPLPDKMIAVLTTRAGSGEKDDREIARDLLDLWKEAGHTR